MHVHVHVYYVTVFQSFQLLAPTSNITIANQFLELFNTSAHSTSYASALSLPPEEASNAFYFFKQKNNQPK